MTSINAHVRFANPLRMYSRTKADAKQDPVMAEHGAKVMDVLVQRLSDLFMAIAEREPSNAVLVKIHSLVRLAKEIKMAA